MFTLFARDGARVSQKVKYLSVVPKQAIVKDKSIKNAIDKSRKIYEKYVDANRACTTRETALDRDRYSTKDILTCHPYLD